MGNMKKGWLNGLYEIAQHCGIHIDTLRKGWMKTHDMPLTKIRGRWYADPETLTKWLNNPHEKATLKNPRRTPKEPRKNP